MADQMEGPHKSPEGLVDLDDLKVLLGYYKGGFHDEKENVWEFS
jgi:hypothetical protein